MAASGVSRKYPEQLRVLVVDPDDNSSKNLVKILEKCRYHVWRSESAAEACSQMLGEKNEIHNFEVVMSDVNVGFEFVDHVTNKLGVPLILMSKNGEHMIEGIEHGAWAYLRKPIRLKDVKDICQHDYRNKMVQRRHVHVPTSPVPMGNNKREVVEVESSNGGGGESSSSGVKNKKPRFVWTPELSDKFNTVVHQIKEIKEKVGPKKILELMDEPSLTREIVASHLQKYRNKVERDAASQVCNTNNIINNQESPQESRMMWHSSNHVAMENNVMNLEMYNNNPMVMPALQYDYDQIQMMNSLFTTSTSTMFRCWGNMQPPN